MTSINEKNKNRWTVLRDDDDIFKRCHFACVGYKDRYIVIAGGREHDMLDDIEYDEYPLSTEMYDITSQSYTTLPDLPEGNNLSVTQGVILKDYFYVFIDSQYIYRMCLSTREEWEHVIDWNGMD